MTDRIKAALDIAINYGGIDGDHHKAWVIDQMVRALTGCPTETRETSDIRGEIYTYAALGESEEYLALVTDAKSGGYGPETYGWDIGIAP